MYHRINRPEPNSSLIVSPKSFARQLDWLENRSFNFLSLDEVAASCGKMPFGARSVALTFDDGFLDNLENAFSLLIARKKNAALFVVVEWIGKKDFLTWNQIRELARQGITIGSHSLSHRYLAAIQDPAELEREVVDSKKRIEDEIGQEVRWFSYPIGGGNARAAEAAKRAGYRAAWVAGHRPSLEIKDPLFRFRRVKVSPSDDSLFHFAIKAYGIKGMFG